jgi:hypothetical protein
VNSKECPKCGWCNPEDAASCRQCGHCVHPIGAQPVKCQVWCSWWEGNKLRHSHAEWMSEDDALSHAAGIWRGGQRDQKYYQIRIHYRRKFNGRWRGAGSKPYPSNDQAHYE